MLKSYTLLILVALSYSFRNPQNWNKFLLKQVANPDESSNMLQFCISLSDQMTKSLSDLESKNLSGEPIQVR